MIARFHSYTHTQLIHDCAILPSLKPPFHICVLKIHNMEVPLSSGFTNNSTPVFAGPEVKGVINNAIEVDGIKVVSRFGITSSDR